MPPPADDMPRDLPSGGRIDGSEHRFPVRVYFEDTDLSGVVYHANYLRFMERARSDMLRLAGVDQRAHHEAGRGAYVLTELGISYRAPARFGDALVVVSRVAQVRAAAVVIQQTVSRGDTILTQARVTAALVAASGRPVRQPAEWIATFKTLIGISA